MTSVDYVAGSIDSFLFFSSLWACNPLPNLRESGIFWNLFRSTMSGSITTPVVMCTNKTNDRLHADCFNQILATIGSLVPGEGGGRKYKATLL